MIRERCGDILDTQAVAIVNPVNTKGVSGAGLAKTLKQRYPEMFREYWLACQRGELQIGTLLFARVGPDNPQHVVCLPTKREWWLPSRLSYVREGLVALQAQLTEREISSVAVPALGCGRGGLDWADVRPLIVEHLDVEGLDVELYVPKETEGVPQ